MDGPAWLRRRAWLVVAASLAAGCASVHVDAQGRRHVVGLVWLTLPPAAVEPVGGETLRSRSVGLTLLRGPLGSSAVLGYSDHGLSAIRNHSAVQLHGHTHGEQR